MKLALCLAVCIAVAIAVEITPKTSNRMLPADVLRDFPGVCFASTLCRTFKENEEWELKPFCGLAKCIRGQDNRLMEQVQDCGPIPKSNDKCKISAKTNATARFPACCPIYDCEAGVQLEFPDLTQPPSP